MTFGVDIADVTLQLDAVVLFLSVDVSGESVLCEDSQNGRVVSKIVTEIRKLIFGNHLIVGQVAIVVCQTSRQIQFAKTTLIAEVGMM